MSAKEINRSNIRQTMSGGKVCFYCEERIPRGEPCVRIKFKVANVGIGTISASEEAHLGCAREVGGAILEESR